jgi:hypothetical protein
MQDRDFIFLIGLLGVFAFAQIIYKRNKLTESQFRIRAIASSFIVILLAVFINFSVNIKISFITLGIIIFILAIKAHNNGS